MRILFIIIICLLSFISNSYAATVNASSCSLTDVRNAINSASRGDTVQVPEGDCDWNDSLVITKAIVLQGAGGTQTKIRSTIFSTGNIFDSRGAPYLKPMIQYAPANVTLDGPVLFRVTGFQFDCNMATVTYGDWTDLHATPFFRVEVSGTSIKKIRIDNNRIINSHRTLLYNSNWGVPISFMGGATGLIDNNYIAGARPGIEHIRWSNAFTGTTWSGWDNGTDDNLFVEDNYIVQSYNYSQVLMTGQGGSFVARYNTFDYTNCGRTWFYASDTHGIQWRDYSSLGAEFYGNKIIPPANADHTLIDMRGSRHKIFYNKSTSTTNVAGMSLRDFCGPVACNKLTNYTCPATALYAGVKACKVDGQTQNAEKTYIWNNRNGNNTLVSLEVTVGDPYYPPPDPNGITGAKALREDVDYAYQKSSYNGTTGVGCGTFANRPSSCTKGTAYWATDQSCSSVSDSNYGINPSQPINGILYYCTNTNTWSSESASYKPYTYPHPFRGSQSASTPAISETSPTGQVACTGDDEDVPISVTVTDTTGVTGVKCCEENGTTCTANTTYASMNIDLSLQSGNSNYGVWGTTRTNSCGTAYAYNCKATNGTNTSSNAVIAYDMENSEDTTNPTISSVAIGELGRTVTITFSEAVNTGGNYSDTDWTMLVNGSPVSIVCPGPWNTDILTCQAQECIPNGATVTLAFNQPVTEDSIKDLAGNVLEDTLSPVNASNGSNQSCGATVSLFDHSATPTYSSYSNGTPTNLGVEFQSDTAGTINDVCFYHTSAMDGETQIASVWCADVGCGGVGVELARKTVATTTGNTWKCQALDTPIGVLANTKYRVSVYFPDKFISTYNFFASGYTSGGFTVSNNNGIWTDSTSVSYPSTVSSTKGNYWIDFNFSFADEGGPWNVTVSKTGNGCSIISQPPEPIEDEGTAEVVVKVRNGWAINVGGDCASGNGVLSGNTYTYTTGQITEDCEVAVTCTEIQLTPWVIP